ncbi:hypothetical protein D3C76_856080 [compost metagenome]
MDVGNAVAVGELQRRMALEERHHVRRRFKKSVDHLRVESLAQFVFQVGTRLGTLLDDAGALRQRIARYPHPAAGPGCSTTEHRVLFHHDDFLPMPGGGYRRRQTGSAGADDQYIAIHAGRHGGIDSHGQCLLEQ